MNYFLINNHQISLIDFLSFLISNKKIIYIISLFLKKAKNNANY